MFYDLNVPYSANEAHLSRTLAFISELGYNVVALNHSIVGKLPPQITCAIPDPLPFKDVPPKLEIRRRVTLTLTESYQNARLAELARAYDILAVRPVDERTLQLACSSLDCDIISLDLTQRLPFYFRFKMLSEAVKSGKRFELCYSQGVLGDSAARRNLISNATQLIRASRGRGLIISSEAKATVGCRGPWDAINLATVWGLAQDRGFEAMSKEPRSVVVTAQLKRTSYRGVIDVVYGGEKPALPEKDVRAVDGGEGKGKTKQQATTGLKRKAVNEAVAGADARVEAAAKPISNREAKRRKHQARLSSSDAKEGATNGRVGGGGDTALASADGERKEAGLQPAMEAG
ncbi:RNA-binding RNA processing protein rpp1 [Friedmanniomyces endolithicus]|uniref:RNA-binding RNA processing protein rpp1 n=2 Tax=Dothideomycetidae TaxID=451867 RepID=A0A4V5N7L3_9PEZI|nr:RNA-binding RNA processing protein rpp1 [Friedmanniomyces endolithicus]KAK5148344.1 RNA-binding RNA processing protein rpp1 [Rachicladosporium monterosium]KAK0343883.1 RNA-binding RNA processing protein rpp1 [Friedmanniomyces endolithicus]KAK0775277.1 RNA-binding RNA processing protein rpp1 [Friedmanniomyces endolithicus]KAK0792924.1 RNA-binding RNA processing protein rpp1 [Friedmanniomyces endolithicus]